MLYGGKLRVVVEVVLFFLCTRWLFYNPNSSGQQNVITVQSPEFLSAEQMFKLRHIAQSLLDEGKGILAADESTGTIGKRFKLISVENNEENRRRYRELLFTTKDLQNYISGVILFEETLSQKTDQGIKFIDLLKRINVNVGIKLDKGLLPFKNSAEKISQGLDGLESRAAAYQSKGITFAKWRSVFQISSTTPTEDAMYENARVLAKYAKICQQNGLVPIIEPEVLAEGNHTIDKSQRVTERVLAHVYKALNDYKVYLEGTILKTNMVTGGFSSDKKETDEEIAHATLEALRRTVPAAVPGIAFLSGGQSELEATRRLRCIIHSNITKPWSISFSFGRALQTSALKAWNGINIEEAKKAFLYRLKANSDALRLSD